MGDIRCALLGSTGMIGQRFIQLLDEHPNIDLKLLFSSDRRTGKTYGKEVEWLLEGNIPDDISRMKLHNFDHELLMKNDIDLIFSALPNSLHRDIEIEAAINGIPVFSNSATHRMDRNVPILVPEVNADHIHLVRSQKSFPGGFIVTNPNCSTAGLVMSLAPLSRFGISRVFVSTYQALSGAGHPGPSSFSMMGNIVPFIGNEEEKMVAETGKILGRITDDGIDDLPIKVFPNCARVPVRDGHLMSINAQLKKDITIEEAEGAFLSLETLDGLHSSPTNPILISRDEDRPQPLQDVMAGIPVPGMAVTIGRIRKDRDVLSFFALVNNTIRGGAGNAILSAELAFREGYIGGGNG